VTIPDAAVIQYDLLKMSIILLETCRSINNIITDNKLVVFFTSLHCTFMLHTQRGCLKSGVIMQRLGSKKEGKKQKGRKELVHQHAET
jgi:hypothetical protein